MSVLNTRLSTFQQYCIFQHVVVTGTLSWLVLVFTNFGALIQYLAVCKVTSWGTSHHYRSENTNHATYCWKVDRRDWIFLNSIVFSIVYSWNRKNKQYEKNEISTYLFFQLEACFLAKNHLNSCPDSDLWKNWLYYLNVWICQCFWNIFGSKWPTVSYSS